MMSYAVFQENTRWFPSKFDDLSANNLDVTTNGTLESYDKAGMARFFDGVDDYIGVQDSNSLDLTSAVTLEAWIKPNRLLDLQTIVCKRSVSQYNYCLRLTGSNIEFFFIGSAATQIAGTSTSPIKLGEWQHVTATYDSSQVKIYINGELQKTSCTSGTCNMAMILPP
jgi:hydrogenase maturation factor HypF (carbamoyltransferase family)